MCEDSARAVCFDVRGPNVTFVLTNNSMIWPEAQSYCREHYTDLASVRNMTENQRLNQLVPAGQPAWIGLFRDSWKWSDGRNSSFSYWRQDNGEPNGFNEICVAASFSYSGAWEDWTCDWRKALICYSLVTTKQVIKLRLLRKDSSLDLNDPAVTEGMLMQLQQKLKDQGVNEDVKLSWKKQSDGKVFHED
ncbi:L-selectin-like isoform X2 [Micropterus salmoides]|uniref:L-selectin-like isoform X2 n=1 Tax=Micropterus salmoides TaxID=27706 RepID=UPI0018EC68EE|nr:L-selectin-like isoform X2 [Micropterus salmoides]